MRPQLRHRKRPKNVLPLQPQQAPCAQVIHHNEYMLLSKGRSPGLACIVDQVVHPGAIKGVVRGHCSPMQLCSWRSDVQGQHHRPTAALLVIAGQPYPLHAQIIALRCMIGALRSMSGQLSLPFTLGSDRVQVVDRLAMHLNAP